MSTEEIFRSLIVLAAIGLAESDVEPDHNAIENTGARGRNGTLVERPRGTPQGGVISPLLANLFLHYAFDVWMARQFPHLPFERYADDAIVHCRTRREAEEVRNAVAQRLQECWLALLARQLAR